MNKKKYKWYYLLFIVLVTAAVLSYLLPIKQSKVETSLAIKETERDMLHKKIVKELTMVFSGYVKVDGENLKGSGINAIRSIISMGDEDFDLYRVFINKYFQVRTDLKVIEPWKYNREKGYYMMVLQTISLQNMIFINYYGNKNELWVVTSINSK